MSALKDRPCCFFARKRCPAFVFHEDAEQSSSKRDFFVSWSRKLVHWIFLSLSSFLSFFFFVSFSLIVFHFFFFTLFPSPFFHFA